MRHDIKNGIGWRLSFSYGVAYSNIIMCTILHNAKESVPVISFPLQSLYVIFLK